MSGFPGDLSRYTVLERIYRFGTIDPSRVYRFVYTRERVNGKAHVYTVLEPLTPTSTPRS